ncbi:hypothetical protein FGL01_01760 [Flavobacterium glycines]|uniref:Uncharacterized protein n=1 Tax=Flavobacterium glycines TaxID=551990 RepID=A0A511C9U6_9FLAO|nr:hypothetical protein FGL01_01760 [Flavobacterium glycines]
MLSEGLFPFAISALTVVISGDDFQNDCSKSEFFCCALAIDIANKAIETNRFFFIMFYVFRLDIVFPFWFNLFYLFRINKNNANVKIKSINTIKR